MALCKPQTVVVVVAVVGVVVVVVPPSKKIEKYRKTSKNRCYTSKIPEFHGYVPEGQLY